MTKNQSYVEHVAIRVRDILWHIRFFRDVLGMAMREVDGPPESPRQYWSVGGMQFISTPDFIAPDDSQTGSLGHIGIMVKDLELALTEAKTWGVQALPQKRNWLQLPDGLVLELIQAKPNINFTTPEKYWDDAKEGDTCTSPTYTVTAERIDAYAELTGDFTPVHVDEDYAKASHFGQRVAHGLMGLSVADGLKTQSEYRFIPGMSLGWTWDFVLPIAINDVLHIQFRIGAMRPSKSKPDWGIVAIPTELINQKGQVVQRGEHRLMVPRRPK